MKARVAFAVAFAVAAAVLMLGCISPQPPEGYVCANGTKVQVPSQCPEFQKYICFDGSIVSDPSQCPQACSVQGYRMLLGAKSHPQESEVRAAGAYALDYFNSSADNESLFFKYQLERNRLNGTITEREYLRIYTAVALYRYVRDNIELSPGRADMNGTVDDLTTLERGRGGKGEKALLLASMLAAQGISARIQVYGDCPTGDPCACIAEAEDAFVAIELPEFQEMRVYANDYYGGSLTTCEVDGGVLVNPGCRDCTFAYGFNCTGRRFVTLYP